MYTLLPLKVLEYNVVWSNYSEGATKENGSAMLEGLMCAQYGKVAMTRRMVHLLINIYRVLFGFATTRIAIVI